MTRQKNKRFERLGALQNVIEWDKNSQNTALANLLNSKNLILELGCGKGEHILALAQRFPQNTCIGVDVKGERIYIGATTASEQDLLNVWFVRAPIEKLLELVPAGSVSQIWLTFCDPQLKKPSKCLASSAFFAQYVRVLNAAGSITLKTDSQVVAEMFEESAKLAGFYTQKNVSLEIDVTSAFEKKWNARGIATITSKVTKS